MKLKFLLGILLIVVLINGVEGRTEVSNCIETCTDTTGCTCLSYCVITGNINQNTNCGGQPTSCAQENRNYWVRDGDCQSTCGDYDNEFMTSKNWEKVDYNCYVEEAPTIVGEEIIGESALGESKTQEIEKTSLVKSVIIVVLIILILWFIFRKKIKKLF